jgi:poly(A) polymerase
MGCVVTDLMKMLKRPTSPTYQTAEQIVLRLRAAGHQALLAGGCVRDLLLGIEPKDYDVATCARPEEVRALFQDTRDVGAQFGVTLVILDGVAYEVTTFRTEDGYADGRHPDKVSFTGVREDAARRDFTINGMYWDPVSGEVLDFVGGQEDLRAGVVRTIGSAEERFREDHLRIIRAVRFAARFGYRIAPRTEGALRSLAELILKVAPERLQQELRVILTDRDPAGALRLMDELGILSLIFPELAGAKGCAQPENYHPEGDVFVHSILTVEKLGPYPDFVMAMAALFHDIGKPEASRLAGPMMFTEHSVFGRNIVREICQRLRMSRDETDRICWLVHRHMYFKDAPKMKDSTLKKLFADPAFDQLARLHYADAMASWGNLDDYHYVLERKRQMPPESINPPPLVNGDDLMRMGYKPGPAFREILSAVREKQLQGELSDREEALRLAGQIAGQIGVPRQQGVIRSQD